jgi:hypothetical protein
MEGLIMKSTTLILLMAIFSRSVYAQVAIIGTDVNWTVKPPNSSESFTLLQDARNKLQWYYVPTQPRLVMRNNAQGNPVPVMQLLRYAYVDANDGNKVKMSGQLQFAVTLDASQYFDYLLKQVAQKVGVSESDVRLSPLQLKSASAAIYTPSGDLVTGQAFGQGAAPVFGSQQIVFSIPLSKVGTEFYDALINGTTGVPVVVNVTYLGMTAPTKGTVKVNWDQAFSHYSSDEKFRASVSGWGWFSSWSANYSEQRSTIRESLINSKSIEIEKVVGESFNDADLDKYLEPIVKRLNDELLADFAPPDKIDPAQAPDPGGARGWSVGKSVAVKDVTKVKHGTESVSLNLSRVIDRATSIQGFIGIGTLSKEARDGVVLDVVPGVWDWAYFIPPLISADADMGLSGIDVEIVCKVLGKKSESRILRWQPATGWIDKDKRPVSVLPFNLLGKNVKSSNDVSFTLTATVYQENYGSSSITLAPQIITPGKGESEAAIANPLELIRPIRVDVNSLTWQGVSAAPGDSVKSLIISAKIGSKTKPGLLRPISNSGVFKAPAQFVALADSDNAIDNAKISMSFQTSQGTVPWKTPAMLKDRMIGGIIVLTDCDWNASLPNCQ